MRGASRGFVPRGTEGRTCSWCGGSWVPACLLSGCRLPVQAAPFSWGRGMAELGPWRVSHHQTHQRLRGALRKGVHPYGSLAAPFSEVKPCAQGSSEPEGLCEGTPRPRAEAFSEGEQQNPAACDLWEVTAAISSGFSWRAQAGERGMLSLQIPEGMDN